MSRKANALRKLAGQWNTRKVLQLAFSAFSASALMIWPASALVINEIDADQGSVDTGEFVELYNAVSAAFRPMA